MTTLTFKGNQIGQAVQFQSNGTTTQVEIGNVWFAATDTVAITFAPGSVNPDGSIEGGAGMITGLTVTTAGGAVTTFFTSPDGLDVDPDPEKSGPEFLYVSESPAAGLGGAYAGLQLEQILISDVALTAGVPVNLVNTGFYFPANQPGTPPSLIGTNGNDQLMGTRGDDSMDGRDGNDMIVSLGGRDTVQGGRGNDVVDAGAAADLVNGGAGDDRMMGAGGADTLNGDQGNDLLDGGLARDLLTGGVGGDMFVFGAGDRVTDFDALEGDQIVFDAALGLDLSMIDVVVGARSTTISYAGQTMTLQGVTQPFDLGNAIKFDYVAEFDFL